MVVFSEVIKTSRERHKLAPYLRLKNSKRTSKCQVFFYSIRKNPKVGPNWRAGGPFRIFQHPFCRKTSKNCIGDSDKFVFEKSLTMPKKLKEGTESMLR